MTVPGIALQLIVRMCLLVSLLGGMGMFVVAAELETIRPVLEEYCFRCHGEKKSKGKVQLQKMDTDGAFVKDIDLTSRVLEVLEFREMPPEDEKQPSPAVRQRLVKAFRSYMEEYLESAGPPKPVVMRRLNRYEYNNTVRDLLRLDGEIYPLPEKVMRVDKPYFDPASRRLPETVRVGNRALGKFQVERPILTGVVPFAIDLQDEHGFNNRGDQLSVSPLLIQSFLELGQSILQSSEFEDYCRISASFFAPLTAAENVDARMLKEQEIALGKERLGPFLERAFRSSVEASTYNRYADFFEREYRASGSFQRSMKQVVSAILASPRFLYLVEKSPERGSTEPLNDYELATRLAYFLWSTMPDDELLALARGGQLRKAEVLEKQVARMLREKKSKALSENFARQWLRLDQLISAVPDIKRFPSYYSRIGCEQWKFGLQMMVEPLLLFESILVEDRSVLLLVDCDYSYRSDELQTWYENPEVFEKKKEAGRFNTGQQVYKRRALTDRRQGGVITSAATLTMTSAPLRTSPITRGAWVATVIFNRPPPPPPDVVPEIEADDAEFEAKGVTLRERLKEHQENPSCVACHSKIDPLGFALENYDAVGRWRERYSSGLEIDATGKLFGETPFRDVVGFKDAVLARPELFLKGFTQHLLSYALGRELGVMDERAVKKIVKRVSEDEGRFSTVILEIAKSRPFRYKSAPGLRDGKSKPLE